MLPSEPTLHNLQDNKHKLSSNYFGSQLLQNDKLLRFQRSLEPFVRPQQSDHYRSSEQKQEPLDWRMLHAILSGFPDVKIPTTFYGIHPATEYPYNNVSKAYQPGTQLFTNFILYMFELMFFFTRRCTQIT